MFTGGSDQTPAACYADCLWGLGRADPLGLGWCVGGVVVWGCRAMGCVRTNCMPVVGCAGASAVDVVVTSVGWMILGSALSGPQPLQHYVVN